jgi:GNAT superfamily N-acetyltransferase
LLAVEQATFNESPYSPREIQAMLTSGSQRAFLAVQGDAVRGFVVAFPTHSLHGPRWEIDLLAVHPAWTGQGLATQLVGAAAASGVGVAERARAAVATDNSASTKAFARAGFRPVPEMCHMLIIRTEGLERRPWLPAGVSLWETGDLLEAADWLPDETTPSRSGPQRDLAAMEGTTLLLAERGGRPAGHAELVQVQTLLYSGLWIESLAAPEEAIRRSLVVAALNRAKAAGLGEVGAMVPRSNWPWQQTLLAEGFRSQGDFVWLTAPLLPPPLAGKD